MIVTPWDDAALDEREAECYALVQRALNAVVAEVTAALPAPVLVAAASPVPDFSDAERAALAAWGIFLTDDLEPFIADTLIQGADNVIAALPVETSPIGQDSTSAYLSSVRNRLANVGDNVWTEIRAELVTGYTAGESVPQLAERLQAYAGFTGTRSLTVARTEVIGAANAGSYFQVLESGLSGTKSWLAADDDRTRLSHNHAENQTVRLTDSFSVEIWHGDTMTGHDMMLYPGDPTATPGNAINCRCVASYELSDDVLTASAVDRRSGKPIAPDKPVYLRVKTLFETEYPDQATIAIRPSTGERLIWNEESRSVSLVRADYSIANYTRGALMAQRKNEEGWRTPSAKVSAPTGGKPIHRKKTKPPVASAAVHTGAMIALVPSEADLDRLQADEPREELHLTLAFLGEAADISPAQRENIIMAALPYFTRPVTTEASSVMVLNPHTPEWDTALVLGVRGMPLVEARENVMSAVRGVYSFEETFKPWLPHVTMAYTDDLARIAEYVDVLGPITFDTLRFAFGGEVIDITLSDEMLTAASRLDNDLRRYWLGPKGNARVGGWGNPGSFTACQREMRSEGVEKRYINGLCANLYHEATGRTPNQKKEDAMTAAAFATPKYAEWSGILTLEGIESGDGRMFNLGSLDWAQLPQPLMYQPASIGGHDGSVIVGKITSINREGNLLYGAGVIDLASAEGPEVHRLMSEEMLNGVSVDVDSVHDADIEMTYDPGSTRPRRTTFKKGRVRGATLVAFPAFVDARLHLTGEIITASGEPAEDENGVLVAASHTITIPDLPPAAWFERPTDVKLSGALTVTDEGRVYGLLAPKNTTHRAVATKVPLRNVDYSRFHKGETIVEGGSRVVTGVITMNCGHAPTENYGTLGNRIEHYDNACSVVANVRVGEHDGEVWVAGALNSFSTPEMVTTMLGCTLSGDWQPHPDRKGIREFIAALLVPVPGFAMARTEASVRYQDGMLVASSIPITREEPEGENPFTIKEALSIARANERKMELRKQLGRDNGM